MKKIRLLMICVMMFSFICILSPCKASAKKIQFEKRTVMIEPAVMGKTYKVTLLNTRKTDKVICSLNKTDSKLAKIVKIKQKKNKTYIYFKFTERVCVTIRARVGGRVYKCEVYPAEKPNVHFFNTDDYVSLNDPQKKDVYASAYVYLTPVYLGQEEELFKYKIKVNILVWLAEWYPKERGKRPLFDMYVDIYDSQYFLGRVTIKHPNVGQMYEGEVYLSTVATSDYKQVRFVNVMHATKG